MASTDGLASEASLSAASHGRVTNLGMLKKVCRRSKLTRREERDLNLEIQFMEGLVQRDPRYVEALQVLGTDYARRGDFGSGVKVDEHLARLRPRDPIVFYNLACSYSLTRQLRRAADALGQALDRGYRNYRFLMKDPDLANLRRHAVFKRVQAKLRSLVVTIS